MTEAFSQFLESKKTAVESPDHVTALREGWDGYVRFAEHPREPHASHPHHQIERLIIMRISGFSFDDAEDRPGIQLMLPHGASWAMPEGLRELLTCAVMGEQFHRPSRC
jgi:hypothetical protein